MSIDYISFIFPNSHNKLVNIELSDTQKINKIMYNTFKNIGELICLDFHGVADLYDQSEKFQIIYQNVLFLILAVIQKQ